jgi:hypothetical protein
MNKSILAVTGAVLLGAVALQFLPVIIPPPPPTKERALAVTIPQELAGWTVTEVPIAETEEMKNVVESMLVYDDHVVRLYQRGSASVMVYIAYWSPGKMPYRMVGAHSPDTCWVLNGWTRHDRAQWTQCPDGSPIQQPIEWGTYSMSGNLQHVMFWHIVGGETYSFPQHGAHNHFALFNDFKRFGLNQRREQFFVRISSNRPFAEIWNDRDFQTILRPIAQLGRTREQGPLMLLPPS